MVGVSHRRKRGGWKPDTATHEVLVNRQFRADGPNRLWFCDITQHRAKDGWVYCAAVIDAYSRRIVVAPRVWWRLLTSRKDEEHAEAIEVSARVERARDPSCVGRS
ncbi:DDE-type integrase/transposase/recombinase [Microcella frigidaquae]|uniref:DDE-type integrase/transposase/recombinase n=1 Tax=Microcella frigidaquae TaxID=424758 RepID=UPI003C7AC3FC